MARSSSLQTDELGELEALLAPFEPAPGPRYRSAPWLKRPFDSHVWVIDCGTRFEVDWRVSLPGGRLLTSPRHTELWEVLRSWLVARTHVDTTGGRLHSPFSERNALSRILHWIDYILLRADELGVAAHGLRGLSTNDLRAMVATVAGSRSSISSVYQWPSRLTEYLRRQISAITEGCVEKARRSHPDLLLGIPEGSDRTTLLDNEEIIKARAWLHGRGLYDFRDNGFRQSPSNAFFARELYAHTVAGRSLPLPLVRELCIGPDYNFHREYPRAPVFSAGRTTMTSRELSAYVDCLRPLELLRQEGLGAPSVDTEDLRPAMRSAASEPAGRYRTLPHSVVFGTLRSAIEYAIQFGDALVDSFLSVSDAAARTGEDPYAFSLKHDIKPYLTAKCLELGVRRYTFEPLNSGIQGGPPKLSKFEWFRQLRSNCGLYEAILVLYGAIQLVTGAVMARRVGELIDLRAGTSLDDSGTRLVFENRKSGVADLRDSEARPIPPVAARFLALLERLQDGLIRIGTLTKRTSLFSAPRKSGPDPMTRLGPKSYCDALDMFCDWTETPLDGEARRYYVRQHQLRRFFAMLFFWGGGFGGMDTLRWFLGHTDVASLWHYITESVPGATLRSVAAEWAAYGVRHATKEAELLAAELAEHFGTSEFATLEEEALVLHLEDLMAEGRLSIEPQFLDGGTQYRIAVVLRPRTEQ